MPQAFGFSFNNEDIEDDGYSETSVARENCEPLEKTSQTAIPTLHPLQELVCYNVVLILPSRIVCFIADFLTPSNVSEGKSQMILL